ncbi:MAG: class I SAM-dependent methyltransferase [Deltaproteobacteria bacterium]|nr:class I SAM-dependent methyltransferase [Deltaproteobacteria bacterium]
MKRIVPEKIEEYAWKHTSEEPVLLRRLARETRAKMENPQMLTGRVEGRFLKFLVSVSEAKRVLEIGTFTGYGSLSMAEALPDDGELLTCENDEEAAKMARRYFKKSPHGGKIRILMGDALDTLKRLKEFFDLIFIDADKENYIAYYEESLRLLMPGGIIAADNALRSGRVLEPKDESSRAIARFNDHVQKDTRVENVLLTVRDGIMLARKI